MERCIIPNPGGELAIEDIIGRDELVARLWEVLNRQSLVLTAERRIGKTTALKKMRAKATTSRALLYDDLESIHTAADFARTVYKSARPYLGYGTRLAHGTRQAAEAVEHVKIGGDKLGVEVGIDITEQSWQSTLVDVLTELHVRRQKIPESPQIVFLWDEFPIMLDNIARRENPQTAMQILDTLRSLRHTCPTLRMVYTGSIGLHHVLRKLKDQQYLNEPLNDMLHEEVGPLDEQSANALARGLLMGIGAAEKTSFPLARKLAEAVDCIPYYMHHLADRLQHDPRILGPETIAAIVAEALVDAQDPWGLRHYDTRIDDYYPKKDRKLIRLTLDVLANPDTPLSFAEFVKRVQASQSVDDDRLRDLVIKLRQDHYLLQTPDGMLSFRFTLIQRWWRLHRGL